MKRLRRFVVIVYIKFLFLGYVRAVNFAVLPFFIDSFLKQFYFIYSRKIENEIYDYGGVICSSDSCSFLAAARRLCLATTISASPHTEASINWAKLSSDF